MPYKVINEFFSVFLKVGVRYISRPPNYVSKNCGQILDLYAEIYGRFSYRNNFIVVKLENKGFSFNVLTVLSVPIKCLGFDEEDMQKPRFGGNAPELSEPLILSDPNTYPKVQVNENSIYNRNINF